jgi:hypothetical protein
MQPHKIASSERKITAKATNHDDFPRLVALNFNDKIKQNTRSLSNGIQKLVLLKEAIKEVGSRLDSAAEQRIPAESLEDRLGITMKFIRSVEGWLCGAIPSCIVSYPRLKDLVANPYDVGGNLSIKLRLVRDHAIELAREHALEELKQVQADMMDGNNSQVQYKKQKCTRLLSRLAPGRVGSVNAIRNSRGEIRTDTVSIANLLKEHWSKIFLAKGIDLAKLKIWLEEDRAHRCEAELAPFPEQPCRLRKRHLRKAVEHSNNSAPGPDGIPFAAWRKLGPLAIDTLFDAFRDMTSADGPERMAEHYPDFNASLLFFLPKKISGATEDGTVFYDADAVRPLNVTNADNRLLASAVRLFIEPFVAGRISSAQRGFIAGRSMLANLVDIDEAMAINAITEDSAAAVFLDFSAAFPSVEQEMMHEIFRALGWPNWLLRFIVVLYQRNFCYIVLDGARFDGFTISRGIRQGCPLSPLLFAVASDLLIRRLQRLLPKGCIRAYADDTAVVIPDGCGNLACLEIIFTDYADVSGLALNIAKTCYVPLHHFDPDKLRRTIHAYAPTWGGISITTAAKYLGFMLGPGRGQSSWEAPMRKFLDRAKLWGSINPGLFHNIMAYRVYIALVLSFICQLDPLPTDFDAAERKACELLFPGGRGWMTAGCLKQLKALGFASELPDLRCCALAAKVRVHKFENIAHGGLKIAQRARSLRQLKNLDDNFIRWARFPTWLDSICVLSLDAAFTEFQSKEKSKPSLLGHEGLPEQRRLGWQARATKLLAPAFPVAAHLHLRRRLDRWNIPTLPGHRCSKALKALAVLGNQVPPRVVATVIRCLCNGWITARRFQRSGSCILGCVDAEDSIEHYALCPAFHSLCFKHLAISRPSHQQALEDFLCINTCCNILPGRSLPGDGDC